MDLRRMPTTRFLRVLYAFPVVFRSCLIIFTFHGIPYPHHFSYLGSNELGFSRGILKLSDLHWSVVIQNVYIHFLPCSTNIVHFIRNVSDTKRHTLQVLVESIFIKIFKTPSHCEKGILLRNLSIEDSIHQYVITQASLDCSH